VYIHLGTADEALVQAVYAGIKAERPEDIILTKTEEILEHSYSTHSGTHVLSHGAGLTFEDIALERWYHMYLASRGARFWATTSTNPRTPTHAGEVIQTEAGVRRIVTDAIFAENRADFFQSFGVNYIGRTYSDPRTAVLVDYKKDKTHNSSNDPLIKALLTSLPEDSWLSQEPHDWGTFGIISTSNVDRLEAFMDMLSETNILAYSTGSAAKLNFIGRDFGKIGTPRPDKKYGLDIRETASRMKAPVLSV
jgi:hypothetical protein